MESYSPCEVFVTFGGKVNSVLRSDAVSKAAHTPDWMIDSIIPYMEEMGGSRRDWIKRQRVYVVARDWMTGTDRLIPCFQSINPELWAESINTYVSHMSEIPIQNLCLIYYLNCCYLPKIVKRIYFYYLHIVQYYSIVFNFSLRPIKQIY